MILNKETHESLIRSIVDRCTQIRAGRGPGTPKRFPEDLKAMVVEAVVSGSTGADLSRLTGVHFSTISKWVAKGKSQAEVPPPVIRELKLVADSETKPQVAGGLVICFPSGAHLEVSRVSDLSHPALKDLLFVAKKEG